MATETGPTHLQLVTLRVGWMTLRRASMFALTWFSASHPPGLAAFLQQRTPDEGHSSAHDTARTIGSASACHLHLTLALVSLFLQARTLQSPAPRAPHEQFTTASTAGVSSVPGRPTALQTGAAASHYLRHVVHRVVRRETATFLASASATDPSPAPSIRSGRVEQTSQVSAADTPHEPV